MKRFTILWCVVFTCLMVFTAQAATGNGITVKSATHHDVSSPLWQMAKNVSVFKQGNREVENRPPQRVPKPIPGAVDTAVQSSLYAPVPLPLTITLNFDAQGADGFAPPDTNASVGDTQVVETVNVKYTVYDKTTGALTLGPLNGNAFFSGFGGQCESQNAGDPIILYDKMAGRWFFSQFTTTNPYLTCIAVSTTSDVTGTYNRYSFSNGKEFPDYPKFGVWPNAYFEGYRDFTNLSTFKGGVACAFDRAAMLAGSAATMQCSAAQGSYDVMLPSDLDGATLPPDGSTNMYVSLGASANQIDTFNFHVDFVTPANTTFALLKHLNVVAYSTICQVPFTRNCIPQPTGGEKLDGLSGFLMYRNAYRNLGAVGQNLVAHTIATSSPSTAKSAVRWYEIRTDANGPFTYQQGTYQNNNNSFWLPSMAADKNGNIVVGFNASSSTLDPSMFFNGRTASTPKGNLELPRKPIIGTGVQKNTVNRWGDYMSVSIDPTDDCTFWMAGEYIKTTGSFNWNTRLVKFKFNDCN